MDLFQSSGDECLKFFFSSRRRHTRCSRDWSSDVCSSDLRSPGCARASAVTSERHARAPRGGDRVTPAPRLAAGSPHRLGACREIARHPRPDAGAVRWSCRASADRDRALRKMDAALVRRRRGTALAPGDDREVDPPARGRAPAGARPRLAGAGRRARSRLSRLRLFGRLIRGKTEQLRALPALRALGPDPLGGIDVERLHGTLARTRRSMKEALMDQRTLAGLGNIQVSESLYRARIDPQRPALSMSRAETERLAGP